MKKELKDYLHLYLGGEAQIYSKDNGDWYKNGQVRKINAGMIKSVSEKGWVIAKPILRPLSDMTDDEYDDYKQLGCATGTGIGDMQLEGRRTAFLLSKHFDLFNLIPEGLAIPNPLPVKI